MGQGQILNAQFRNYYSRRSLSLRVRLPRDDHEFCVAVKLHCCKLWILAKNLGTVRQNKVFKILQSCVCVSQ